MGNLTNRQVNVTYGDMLQVQSGTNTGLAATTQPIEDGKGQQSPLKISLTKVDISSGFQVGGVDVTASSADLNKTSTLSSTYQPLSLILTNTTASFTTTLETKLSGIGEGADVVGPASSTDNALARFDATTGKLIQNSAVTVDDTGNALGLKIDANATGNAITNIDVADLAAGTDGELITWDASGNPATVGAGTAAQILTSNGAGAAPTFQDAAGGGAWSVKASGTLSAASSLDITGITKTTRVFMSVTGTVDFSLRVRTSTDGGTTYDSGSTEYSYVQIYAGSTTALAKAGADTGVTDINTGIGAKAGANDIYTLELTLHDPSNTTRYTHITGYSDGPETANSDSVRFTLFSGARKSNADVDAIQIYPSSGTISGSYTILELN